MKRLHRTVVLAGFFLVFLAVYFPAARLALTHGVFHQVKFPGEEWIPFLPWSFFVYLSAYLFISIPFFVVKKGDEMKRFLKTYAVAMAIHGLIWAVYPVPYLLRPKLGNHPEGLLGLISLFYGLDTPPLNTFPSLHVTGSFISVFVLRRHWPSWGPVIFVIAGLISLSTLTFKQHYMADVLAGFAVAFFLNLIFFRRGVE